MRVSKAKAWYSVDRSAKLIYDKQSIWNEILDLTECNIYLGHQ